MRQLIKGWVASGVKTGYVYWLLDHYPQIYSSDSPVTAKLKNSLRMECDLKDHIQSRIFFFGAYEPIEVHLLSTLLTQDSVFLDVGANIGFYSLMLSQKCKTVYSFEPIASNYAILERNIKANNLQSKIVPIKKGLWNVTTTLEFSLPDDAENNIGTFTAGRNKNKNQNVSCDVVTLDSFVEDMSLTRIDAIKMDIEGSELFALRGAEKTIRRFQPILQIELNSKACAAFDYILKDLENYLKSFNYSFYKVGHTAENSEFIKNFDGLTQVNILAFPLEKKNLLDTKWNGREIVRSFLN